MNERDRVVREPDGPERSYQAQPLATAEPGTATHEREREDDETNRERDTQAIDESAATKPTEPSGQTSERRETKAAQPPDGDGSRSAKAQSLEHFSGRWEEIQSGFVDDPRRTVERADRLVADVIDQVTTMFNEERQRLEAQWSRGGNVDTEELRLVMQRYRDFFRTVVGR